ncbi:MAG TPA: isochorismatase family protein [Alphaproteobacteria bacterium]|jgi:nicotinamidase-related amidase|nr:isochorismatase family protein [Micavibrio sp.]MBK9563396.1 isochorismatase family protein [Micavibrio sp.]HQX27389.1 isochorismatase family protein [Alphaproteobacteria bacterium]
MADILMLVDFQNYWADKNPETAQRIRDNIDQWRAKGIEILWVFAAPDDAHGFKPLPPMEMANRELEQIFNAHARFDYDPAMPPAPQDFVIGKGPFQTDAFSNPYLLEFLKTKDNIYIAGFMEGYCVFDTADSAQRAKLPVTVLADISADENDLTDPDDPNAGNFEKAGINTGRAADTLGLRR